MTTTDDTRQRSIAEIIGWRYCSRGRHWIPPDLDGDDHAARPVTPDDMLAWLDAREGIEGIERCSIESERSAGNRWSVYVWWQSGDEWLDDWIHTPTLHAALEAAVRAVAEESDE